MNKDIQDRIMSAANELFAQSTTGEFPSVEAVRQRSRASMNYVVEVLRDWRQQQRQQVKVTRNPLPHALQEAMQHMGQAVWDTAQGLANEALESERAAFELEKSDITRLSIEQSKAFDGISAELEQAKAKNTSLQTELEAASKTAAHATQRLHMELAQITAHAQASEQMHSERTRTAETERDLARHEAIEAREVAAALRGQVEAMTAHNTALLERINPLSA